MGTTAMKFGNVNILDLQNATEESIAGVESMGNVNLIFHNRATAGLIKHIKIGNINRMLEMPEKVKILQRQGQVVINKDFFTTLNEPTVLVVMGQLIIESGVTPEVVGESFKGLIVMGQALYPEAMAGVIESHTLVLLGQGNAYPALKTFVQGKLVMSQAYLNGLADQSEIIVVGDLTLPKVVDDQQLRRKLAKLFVVGDLICHEENVAAIQAALVKEAKALEIVPAGFELVEQPLSLDNDMLDALPSKNLYCKQRVIFGGDVTVENLESRLGRLVCCGLLIAPAGLKPVLAKRVNLFETQAIFYMGKLLLAENEDTLGAARLEAMKEPFTLVVSGELSIQPDAPLDDLDRLVLKAHNFGQIRGSAAQIALLQNRLGIQKGELLIDKPHEDENEEENKPGVIGNVNYLAL